tara:strand:- start:31 stop:243 length:213 start_codon:yes stop_codon:yes gene_type:complete
MKVNIFILSSLTSSNECIKVVVCFCYSIQEKNKMGKKYLQKRLRKKEERFQQKQKEYKEKELTKEKSNKQ